MPALGSAARYSGKYYVCANLGPAVPCVSFEKARCMRESRESNAHAPVSHAHFWVNTYAGGFFESSLHVRRVQRRLGAKIVRSRGRLGHKAIRGNRQRASWIGREKSIANPAFALTSGLGTDAILKPPGHVLLPGELSTTKI